VFETQPTIRGVNRTPHNLNWKTCVLGVVSVVNENGEEDSIFLPKWVKALIPLGDGVLVYAPLYVAKYHCSCLIDHFELFYYVSYEGRVYRVHNYRHAYDLFLAVNRHGDRSRLAELFSQAEQQLRSWLGPEASKWYEVDLMVHALTEEGFQVELALRSVWKEIQK